jgi:hypothetical protein
MAFHRVGERISLGFTSQDEEEGDRCFDRKVHVDVTDDDRGRFGCVRNFPERNPRHTIRESSRATNASLHFVAGPPVCTILLSIEGGRMQAQSERHGKDLAK